MSVNGETQPKTADNGDAGRDFEVSAPAIQLPKGGGAIRGSVAGNGPFGFG